MKSNNSLVKITNVSDHLEKITKLNIRSVNGVKIESINYFDIDKPGYTNEYALFMEFTDVNGCLRNIHHTKQYPEITSVIIEVR